MGGYFKVYREIFQHEIFKHELDFRLFMLILGNAVYNKEGVMIDGVHVKRGQWIRSYRRLAQDLEYKEKRGYKQYGLATIKRAIERLIKNDLVTVSETESGTLFTVVNYEKYQGFSYSEEQDNGTLNGTKSERHRNNNKNDNKLPNDDKEDDQAFWNEIADRDLTEAEKKAQQIVYRYQQNKEKLVIFTAVENEWLDKLVKADIPLHDILEQIDELFKYKQSQGDEINSFSYCAKTILNRYIQKQKAEENRKNEARKVRSGRNQKAHTEYPEIGQGYYDQFEGLFAN